MNHIFLHRKSQVSVVALACAMLMVPVAATAQEVAPQTSQSDDSSETADIVVTGTLLRGIAPTGTNVVGVSSADVLASGTSSSNDLLARVPQVSSTFNSLPTPTASDASPIVRPSIRDLGGAGGTTTLVLVNGRRLVGQGILQTFVDPSLIPAGILDRVEVIPDGGSSIYGSDAVGGVINFITKKRFDGVETSGRYGFGDNYTQVDANLTAGKDWGSGSLLLSYAYAWHDNVLGSDRDYIRQDNRANGGTDQRSSSCNPGNITVGSISYALPGRVPGSVNRCDETDVIDFYPRESRHAVYGSLTEELNDSLTFDMTAFWAQRKTVSLGLGAGGGTGVRGSGTITSSNPYFRPIGAETSQTVSFSYANAFGPALSSPSTFESMGVTPSFTFKPGGDWQIAASANFGRSFNLVKVREINAAAQTAALAGTSAATALNPYDPSASSPGVLASILDFERKSRGTQELAEGRIVADGTVLSLPGGNAKLAIGAEYHYENISVSQQFGNIDTLQNYVRSFSKRNVKSAFAELFVPIFGADNGFAGMRGLDFSASVRHDDYSDVGGTTNPKFGFNYRPFDGLKIRGNWGKSFHAPSLSDLGTAVDSRVQILPVSPFRRAEDPAFPAAGLPNLLRPTILLAGGNPNLRPETADTWSLGADFTPAFASGLKISATYWNVDFRNAIQVPPFFTGAAFYANPNYTSFYTLSPTLAQVQAAAGSLRLDGAASLASLYAGPFTPYVLIDARRNNLGSIKTDGIDFDISYRTDTGFGSVDAGVAGSYVLNRDVQAVRGGPFVDFLENGYGQLSFVGTVGAKVGSLTARVTVNYKDGYPIVGDPTQSDVASFTSVNMFLNFDIPAEGILGGTSLSMNVDNIFDKTPPYRNDVDGVEYTNLGRVVSIGLRKTF